MPVDRSQVPEKVRRHFEADAERFDAIYRENKGPVERFIDCVWRGVVRRRLDLTLEALHPLEGKSILDVGCGSGRFCLAFAEGGASRVLGVDFAEAMIEIAREYARRLNLESQCEFRVGSYPEDVPERGFDAATALGFFDYIEEPLPLMRAMGDAAPAAVVMSFPKAREWRVPLRRLRFKRLGCPLFLYEEAQVRRLLKEAAFADFDWTELDRDYFVVARR